MNRLQLTFNTPSKAEHVTRISDFTSVHGDSIVFKSTKGGKNHE